VKLMKNDQRSQDRMLREQLVEMLRGGSAHLTFANAVKGLPAKLRGVRVGKSPHTAWRLVEHMRIAQWDILEFSRSREHESPKWPAGYWPPGDSPASAGDWAKSVRAFERDLREMIELVKNPQTDLLARIPWGDGQTIAREAMLLADHNAYHLGQLVELRRGLGAWDE
jgi:hypothetical protein